MTRKWRGAMPYISCITAFVVSVILFPRLASAAENNGPPVLEGIVHVTDPNSPPLKLALLQIGSARNRSHPILREGERERGCEVRSILPEQGKVVIVDVPSGAPLDLYLTQPLAGQEPPSFQFRDVELVSILDLLQDLSNRSVLAPAAIRTFKFEFITLITPAYHSRAEAAAALKDVLQKKELTIQPRGEKFLFVLPSRDAEVLKFISDPPSSDPSRQEAPKIEIQGAESFPPGLLKFN